ncbi:hypothetical protein SFUMM280S_06378 [Streptomyces fumanus]
MATPLPADAPVTALTARGRHRRRTTADRRTHNRNSDGARGPGQRRDGHHTVTSGTDASVDLCYDGTSELPGPLLPRRHRQGRHGPPGRQRPRQPRRQRRRRRPRRRHRRDRAARAEQRRRDGNTRFYGFECVNLGDGPDPWPEAQSTPSPAPRRDSAGRTAGARPPSSATRSGPARKIDPRGVTMSSLRARVETLLGEKPATTTPRYQPFPGAAWFKNKPSRRSSRRWATRGRRGLLRLRRGPRPAVDRRGPRQLRQVAAQARLHRRGRRRLAGRHLVGGAQCRTPAR